MQFLFCWQASYPFTYCFISFVTPGHQKFLVTNSTVFYYSLCSPIGVLWCNLIISTLNLSSFGIYTFPSLYIMLFTSCYSLSLNIFTPACFISSTAFTTSLSCTFDYLTFFSRSTLSTIISTASVLLTSSYSAFTNVLFSLSLSIPASQSGLLLRLSTFLILLPGTCFNMKSNLDRYNAYLVCLQFNFCTFMKYSRFLWLVQILNLIVASSRKYLHASKHLIMANISLLYIS